MTTPQYIGFALCYDQSRITTYQNACKAVDEDGNSYQIQDGQFECAGALMGSFHDVLVEALGQDVCVCSFANANPLSFYAGYGPCNGACISTTGFSCDGLLPVVGGGENSLVSSAVTTTFADATSSTTTVQPTAPPTTTNLSLTSQASSTMAGNSATPTASSVSSGSASAAAFSAPGWKKALSIAVLAMSGLVF